MTQFFGKYRGKVENNVDPLQQGRVQVSVPAVLGEEHEFASETEARAWDSSTGCAESAAGTGRAASCLPKAWRRAVLVPAHRR